MTCERVKVLSYPQGMYVMSTDHTTPPCRYRVRWCPKDGQVELLADAAPSTQVVKVIREHRVLGDTINHLMALALD